MRVCVDDLPMAVVSDMDDLVLVDLAEPHVVALSICVKDVDCDVWSAHLTDDSTISSVSNIDCSVFSWSVTNKWLCSLEGMYMVLEDGHYFVLIKIWHPMEERIEVSCWISIKRLTNRVDGNVIADKLELILVVLEGIYHEILLVTR